MLIAVEFAEFLIELYRMMLGTELTLLEIGTKYYYTPGIALLSGYRYIVFIMLFIHSSVYSSLTL